MSTITKDLGVVTAYGYAVSKGYTGTEEEFAELMASYATVAESAAQSAQTATEKAQAAAQAVLDAVAAKDAAVQAKNDAETAKTSAQQSATSAGNSASAASGSATNASQSAQAASDSASAAAQSATNASGSATAANTAKEAAVSAKGAAETAQGKAETAQSKAEEAQGKAEEAADDLSAEVEQIETNKNDIANLKSEISDIEEITVKTTEHTETTDITSDLTFTDGYMNSSGETGASSNYKYTNKIDVAEGDVILSGTQSYNLRYITAYSGDTVVSAKGTDNVSTYTVPSEIDSVIVTIYSAVGTTSNAILHTTTVIERENILNDTIDNINDTIGIIEGGIDSVNDRTDTIERLTIVEDVDVVTTDLTSTLTFTDGFVDTDGNIGSSTNYKYTEHIPVSEGDVIFTANSSYLLRYITAYNGNNVESSKSASNVLTYTVPSGVDSVIVTVYSATDLVAGTVEKTVTTVEKQNINDEAISEIKNNTIYERTNSTDITASLTFTNGYVNKQGLVVSGSSTYKYSARISVSEGDVFSTAEYPFRYVTAYNGTAIEAKSAEAVMSYTVPSGISEVILTMYIASTGSVMKSVKEPYNLFYNSLSQKNVGYFEKPYICLSCDDGADELATYTIPMIISKGVPCTFGLYKTSPVFQHGYTQTVVNAVNNNNCEVAQHGGQHSWTDYNAEELVAFFDDEELFWKNIGVDVKSAIYPTHLSNPMVRAITGSRFGCCRSGYNYDGILYYDDESKPSGTMPYYGTGARSNLYAMASWNMPAGKDLQFAKNCIDWAIANNKLIHFYWHDWDLDSVSKQVLEDTIDYAKTQNINFIKLSEVPYIK